MQKLSNMKPRFTEFTLFDHRLPEERPTCVKARRDDLMHLRWTIHYFLSRRLVRELAEAHSRKNRLEGIMLLRGHGVRESDHYRYWDSWELKSSRLVQEWIDENDGSANLLIISACNPGNYSLSSGKSIVVHPDRNISYLDLLKRDRNKCIRIFVPGIGYVENNYRLLKRTITSLSE